MHLLIWNFLTFHKYQKQKFLSLFKLPPCLLPPSSLAPWKRREFKKSSYDLAPKIWFFLLVKSGLHAKDESCSFKIERVMAIYVNQGDMKSQYHQILNYQNHAQFFSLESKYLHVISKLNNMAIIATSNFLISKWGLQKSN